MSDEALRKAIRDAMEYCARGRDDFIEAPPHQRGNGPCPNCKSWVQPTDFGLECIGAGRRKVEPGLIVCASCYVALKIMGPGQFQALTKREIKRLPKDAAQFLDRSVEIYRASKRLLPH